MSILHRRRLSLKTTISVLFLFFILCVTGDFLPTLVDKYVCGLLQSTNGTINVISFVDVDQQKKHRYFYLNWQLTFCRYMRIWLVQSANIQTVLLVESQARPWLQSCQEEAFDYPTCGKEVLLPRFGSMMTNFRLFEKKPEHLIFVIIFLIFWRNHM